MAYVLVLLGLVGAFVWISPARNGVSESSGDSLHAAASVARQYASPLVERGSQLLSKIRAKAMELVREQLHDAIDNKVQ